MLSLKLLQLLVLSLKLLQLFLPLKLVAAIDVFADAADVVLVF